MTECRQPANGKLLKMNVLERAVCPMVGKLTIDQQQADAGKSYLGVGIFWPYLSIPRRRIFDSSVCRGIPSFAAAPDGPEIRP